MLRALLVDAGGTLLQLREPVGLTYARLGRPFGLQSTPEQIQAHFLQALRAVQSPMAGDGRPYWRQIVAMATGLSDPDYFEAVYAAFGPEAWSLAPDALETFDALRARGVKVAVVSNWDTRLRPLLAGLGVLDRADAAIISGEIGVEKPDPAIFLAACRALSVPPAQALHIGDSQREDVDAARAAGLVARRWGQEVSRFPSLLAEAWG